MSPLRLNDWYAGEQTDAATQTLSNSPCSSDRETRRIGFPEALSVPIAGPDVSHMWVLAHALAEVAADETIQFKRALRAALARIESLALPIVLI